MKNEEEELNYFTYEDDNDNDLDCLGRSRAIMPDCIDLIFITLNHLRIIII